MILHGTVTIRNEAVMVVDCGEIQVQFPASDPHAANLGEEVHIHVVNGTYQTVDRSFREEPKDKKNTTRKESAEKLVEQD